MAVLKYTLLRVVLLVPLVVLFYWLGLGVVFSVIAATLIAFCLAYLFFRPQRDAATASMRSAFSAKGSQRRAQRLAEQSSVEDAFVEHNPQAGIDASQKPRANTSANE
ncbi:DUF4229 domain-containing protein [Acaricomes phytoseiuli]|uniref:DUF4229 domain-containing protein n=1 Tax=Acaricomes phytoseiuli TaxID=291968 RepID=UPI000360C563|nr:DUF4229 domain-containing protein [Acaricomes phytoseiuli]MCW1250059.1 DUF4229 domain-containing protein [Acaricomes phytoseiuli]